MALPVPSADRGLIWANRMLLLAVALVGIAHVAFLPPFEGFDETAHFSYIQQIGDTGAIPRYGADMLSRDVDSYPGPRHYSSLPPYDHVNGLTYRAFFNNGPPPSLTPDSGFSYRPSLSINAEAQHPPLYYALLAPFYLLAKGLSWPGLFLVLRLVSWSFAFAGFAIGCRATQTYLRSLDVAPAYGLLAAGWPFLFPQFFPEMARLGNDSLCLLLMGVGWYLLLRLLDRGEAKVAAWFGLVLGLGLLTKAFFVPILAGCAGILVFATLRDGNWRQLRNAILAVAIALLVGGGWYLYRYLTVGSFIQANDVLALQKLGPIWPQIIHNFTIVGLLRGISQLVISFTWAGSWSYGRFSPIFTVPVILLAAIPLLNWLRRLRWSPVPVIAPLFIAAPMFLGMVYYLLTQLARPEGGAGTPGWYFHILAGPLSLVLVIGWRQHLVLGLLTIYALLFHAVMWTTQLSLFSGCAFKAGDYKYLQIDLSSCLIDTQRLAVLGEPILGGAALAAALVAGAMAVWSYKVAPAKA